MSAAQFTMHDVKSSNIAAIGHDGHDLKVKFTNKTTYLYRGVPAHEFNALLNAPSVGKYFMANIRSRYMGEKIDG